MTTDHGVNIPVKIIDNHDRTYRVEFEATVVGTYNTNVSFASQSTPGSPYKVRVLEPGVDVSKVRVTDLPEGVSSHSSTYGRLTELEFC
jgi:Filamin/ABP280 repeat